MSSLVYATSAAVLFWFRNNLLRQLKSSWTLKEGRLKAVVLKINDDVLIKRKPSVINELKTVAAAFA